VSTIEVPGLGEPFGMFVMADGTRLVITFRHTLQLLTPAGWMFSIGVEDEDQDFEDGKGANARFYYPGGMTVDTTGHIVVADTPNSALRRVSKAGDVSMLAGNGKAGFAEWQGDSARFNCPHGVALAMRTLKPRDQGRHARRRRAHARRQPGGWVCRRAGRGRAL
jgi:hypothetical protein